MGTIGKCQTQGECTVITVHKMLGPLGRAIVNRTRSDRGLLVF
jgi:hypothetical protein